MKITFSSPARHVAGDAVDGPPGCLSVVDCLHGRLGAVSGLRVRLGVVSGLHGRPIRL